MPIKASPACELQGLWIRVAICRGTEGLRHIGCGISFLWYRVDYSHVSMGKTFQSGVKLPLLWWWKWYLFLKGQSWGDFFFPSRNSLPALLPSVCPIKPMCDPGAWLFSLVWVSSGLQEWLRIHDLHQSWSKAKLMPSFLLSSLILGRRPGIPEKLIETEHQL